MPDQWVIPLGGVVCRQAMVDAFMEAHAKAGEHVIEFFHGYTYSGHPVACAAAIATLQLLKHENLVARAGEKGRVLGDAAHAAFKGLPNVGSVRALGLAAAVELAPNPTAAGKRAYDIFIDCYQKGSMVRPAGENIVICPPYIVEKSQIEQLVDTVAQSIRAHA